MPSLGLEIYTLNSKQMDGRKLLMQFIKKMVRYLYNFIMEEELHILE
jgi:hypothetical protein